MATDRDRYKSSLDKIKQKQKDLEAKTKGVFFQANQGQNLIRVLPADSSLGLDTFYYEYFHHYNVGKFGFTCNKTFEQPCVICKKMDQWADSDSVKKQKIADKLYCADRYALTVGLPDTPEEPPKLFCISSRLLGQFLQLCNDPDYFNFTDPVEGYDLVLNRTGLKLNTEYTVRPRKNSSPLKNTTWLRKRPKFDKIIKPYVKEEVIEGLKLLIASDQD